MLFWAGTTVLSKNRSFKTPWQASIRGLDLAWEVGTILANPTPSFSRSSPSRSAGFHQVTFAKYVEFYVGFEDNRALCEGDLCGGEF